MNDPDDDALQALAYAMELQHEQELLRADPAYREWLDQLEQEHAND